MGDAGALGMTASNVTSPQGPPRGGRRRSLSSASRIFIPPAGMRGSRHSPDILHHEDAAGIFKESDAASDESLVGSGVNQLTLRGLPCPLPFSPSPLSPSCRLGAVQGCNSVPDDELDSS